VTARPPLQLMNVQRCPSGFLVRGVQQLLELPFGNGERKVVVWPEVLACSVSSKVASWPAAGYEKRKIQTRPDRNGRPG
jgi:hypothetical protein